MNNFFHLKHYFRLSLQNVSTSNCCLQFDPVKHFISEFEAFLGLFNHAFSFGIFNDINFEVLMFFTECEVDERRRHSGVCNRLDHVNMSASETPLPSETCERRLSSVLLVMNRSKEHSSVKEDTEDIRSPFDQLKHFLHLNPLISIL